MLGPKPDYTYSADAVTRETLLPMMLAHGRVLSVSVSGNPVRDPGLGAGTYAALTVAATRGSGGNLYLLVVNRMPFDAGEVQATVALDGFTTGGTAFVRQVTSGAFTDWNDPDQPPAVQLETSSRPVGGVAFSATFPAHSITVYRIPPG